MEYCVLFELNLHGLSFMSDNQIKCLGLMDTIINLIVSLIIFILFDSSGPWYTVMHSESSCTLDQYGISSDAEPFSLGQDPAIGSPTHKTAQISPPQW